MLESNWAVTGTVDNRDLGVFDSFDGGDGDSEETKYPPGAMGPEESLGGRQTRDNFTVGRRYKLDRDHPLYVWLDSRRGKGEFKGSAQPLDPDGNPYGKPLPLRGKLKKVTRPKHNSTSSDPAMIELEISAHGD